MTDDNHAPFWETLQGRTWGEIGGEAEVHHPHHHDMSIEELEAAGYIIRGDLTGAEEPLVVSREISQVILDMQAEIEVLKARVAELEAAMMPKWRIERTVSSPELDEHLRNRMREKFGKAHE